MIPPHPSSMRPPLVLWVVVLLFLLWVCTGRGEWAPAAPSKPSPLTLPTPPPAPAAKPAPVTYGPKPQLHGAQVMEASMAAVALTLAPAPTNSWWVSPNVLLVWNISTNAAVTGYQVQDGTNRWPAAAPPFTETNLAIGTSHSIGVCCTTTYGTNSAAAALPLDTRIGTLTITTTNGWPLLLWPTWPTNNWQVLESTDLKVWSAVTPVLTNGASGLWRFLDATNRSKQTFYRLKSL